MKPVVVAPWHTAQLPADAAGGLHAFVVGVSYYDYLPTGDNYRRDQKQKTFTLRQVETPATSALAFAKWLRDEYYHPRVPVAGIRLLLSPSRNESKLIPELASESGKVQKAVSDLVDAQLKAWQEECAGNSNNVAVFYACGHGIHLPTKEDSLVLLQDFAQDKEVFKYTLNVGRVWRGMRGAKMPQKQFYFVDTCRSVPDAVKEADFGLGVGLAGDNEDGDVRSAPIFFSAPAGMEADAGVLGRGTHFTRGLIDCLNGRAAQGPRGIFESEEERSNWHVSVSSLIKILRLMVVRLCPSAKVVPGGQPDDALINVLKEPPRILVGVDVDPDPVAQIAEAELWDFNHKNPIMDRKPCWTRPCYFEGVPAGLYRVDIHVHPPHLPKEKLVVADPPEAVCRISFP